MARSTLQASPRHPLVCCVPLAILVAGCGTAPRSPGPADAGAAASVVSASAGEGFVVAAHELDTWNAVGQLIVRTAGMRLDARSEMLDLHAVHYRGEEVLVLTRGLPLAPGTREPATRVAAIAKDGTALDSAATRELLALLRRALPAEIARVRALQAENPGARR